MAHDALASPPVQRLLGPRLLHLLLALAAFVLLAACGGSDSGSASAEDKAILDVVRENLRALKDEDLPAAMRTIDPDSDAYDSTEAFSQDIFDAYDLSYELKELKLVSKSDDEARVHFVQVTRKKKGPDFRDNEVEGEHVLRKVGGHWLIFETLVENIRYLN